MSLDITLTIVKRCDVYSGNITPNLGKMAGEAGIYYHLWRPDELGITTAKELIEPLREGISLLKAEPSRFEKYNASNGWGTYEQLLKFAEDYLYSCEEYPDAEISISR